MRGSKIMHLMGLANVPRRRVHTEDEIVEHLLYECEHNGPDLWLSASDFGLISNLYIYEL